VDPREIVVPGTGAIYLANPGSLVPDVVTTALGAEWLELGYATEDGVKWTETADNGGEWAWQNRRRLRDTYGRQSGEVVFTLLQWSSFNLVAAFGGGHVEEVAPGLFTFTPPRGNDPKMLAVEWADGARHYRVVFLRGSVSQAVEVNLVRTAAALLPMTFVVFAADEDADPFLFQTDDPAFAPVDVGLLTEDGKFVDTEADEPLLLEVV
jgi:hypothetical protein